MFPGIQTEFNIGFNRCIDYLINSMTKDYEKKICKKNNLLERIDIKLGLETSKAKNAYNFRVIIFNATTCLAIFESAMAVVALATGLVFGAVILGVVAIGSLVLRELIDQNIKDTVTGSFMDIAREPGLFRKTFSRFS